MEKANEIVLVISCILWGGESVLNDKIDIILTWVDGNDPVWKKEKEACLLKEKAEEESNSNIRFESWDNLQYWFRAVEQFMPWVNQIVLVTYGHLPRFLKKDHPKLKIIKHIDYIPEKYLPTFNSNTIEMNFHRIPQLSENYILFNDDFFPLQPIEETYFFRNNKVCDEAVENIITTAAFGPVSNMARYAQVNNMFIINKHFKKREVQGKNREKWYCKEYGELLDRTKSLQYWYDFPGFYDPHMASAMKKSVLAHLWKIEGEALDRASRNQFRACTDITQYLIRYWQLCVGEFYPRRTLGKLYFVDANNYKEVAAIIAGQKYQMVSLNENCTDEEFEIIKDEINAAFAKIFPCKSSFEK